MDIGKLLTGLYHERDRIDAAIVAIERLALNSKGESPDLSKRRGRPPGSKNKAKLDEILTYKREG
jgi:hypothetical protein